MKRGLAIPVRQCLFSGGQMLDAALAKTGLEEQTLRQHTSKVIQSAIQICNLYGVDDKTKETIILASLLHDMGKYSRQFQRDIHRWKELRPEWIRKLRGDGKRHEIYSLAYTIFLNDTLRKDRQRFNLIKAAILFTHYGNKLYWDSQPVSSKKYEIKFFEHQELDVYDFKEYTTWMLENKEGVRQFLKGILEENSILTLALNENISNPPLSDDMIYDELYRLEISLDEADVEQFKQTIEIMGLVKKSDHAASAGVGFEQTETFDINTATIHKTRLKFGQAWQYELAKKLADRKKHLILIAPTGSGKSEFALAFHKVASKKKRMVLVLPLRAALNMLFDRYNEYDPENVDLIHSTAFIKYLKEKKDQPDTGIEEDLASARLFLKPYTLCTPEQAMLGSLKYFGFDNVLATLGRSTVVIDEIQAYTPEMNAILLSSLEQVHLMGGNILIMTATLPAYLERILNELEFSKSAGKFVVESRISGKYDNEKIELTNSIKNVEIKRHKIQVSEKHLADLEVIRSILQTHRNNPEKKILVIANTVGIAVEVYDRLKREIGIDGERKLGLLHSRLKEKEKAKRIDRFDMSRENWEKKYSADSFDPMRICVATQILEASVDVDADYLFTQISPIESQIQRWGRVYRSRTVDYGETEPNVCIYTGLEIKPETTPVAVGVKEKKKGKRAKKEVGVEEKPELQKDYTGKIYDLEMCKISKTVLLKKNGVLMNYLDQRELIVEAGKDKEKIDRYVNATKKAMETLVSYGAVRKSEAQEVFRRISGSSVLIPESLIEDLNALREGETDKKLKELWGVRSPKDVEALQALKVKISELIKTAPNNEERKKIVNTKYRYLELVLNNSVNIRIDDVRFSKDIYGIGILNIPDQIPKNEREKLKTDLDEYGWCKQVADKFKRFKEKEDDAGYII